jgi:probable phosphoglycerate mutase
MGAPHPIYLIRHGETAYNAGRILQTPEVPLSERGAEQARRLSARLAGAGIARILSSDLERALATARALAGATGAPVHLDALLQERNFGELRGRPYRELGFDPFAPDYVPPGGESVSVFEARVARAWERIRAHAAEAGGPLAVVTHGLVCLTTIDGPPWTVRLLACTAHLAG